MDEIKQAILLFLVFVGCLWLIVARKEYKDKQISYLDDSDKLVYRMVSSLFAGGVLLLGERAAVWVAKTPFFARLIAAVQGDKLVTSLVARPTAWVILAGGGVSLLFLWIDEHPLFTPTVTVQDYWDARGWISIITLTLALCLVTPLEALAELPGALATLLWFWLARLGLFFVLSLFFYTEEV